MEPPVSLKLFRENLTDAAATAVQPVTLPDVPAVLPATPSNGLPVQPTTPSETAAVTGDLPDIVDTPVTPSNATGLLVKNYAGDALVFTINNQTVTIAENGEQLLDLPTGSYSYTASVPFAAANGIVELSTGQRAELSVVTNVEHNALQTWFTPDAQ